MTRVLALAALACLTSALLVALTVVPAAAAERPCRSTITLSGTRYVVIGDAWQRPGWRQMARRKLWSATLTYYQCKRT